MNTQSPLVPQGSLTDQKNKGRARVKIAVFFVLAVHGIGLLALLMQGCRKDNPSGTAEATNNAAAPMTFDSTNAVVADSNAVAAVTPSNVPPAAVDAGPAVTTVATDYKIVSGDNFWTIGKKFGVSAKAIADANPGVDPAKLKVAQVIHIPAAVKTQGAVPAATSATEPGTQVYEVKSGDTLTKIAADHHTTAKAIRAANSLATDRITVGQKLKIPSKASSTDAGAAPGTATPPHSR